MLLTPEVLSDLEACGIPTGLYSQELPVLRDSTGKFHKAHLRCPDLDMEGAVSVPWRFDQLTPDMWCVCLTMGNQSDSVLWSYLDAGIKIAQFLQTPRGSHHEDLLTRRDELIHLQMRLGVPVHHPDTVNFPTLWSFRESLMARVQEEHNQILAAFSTPEVRATIPVSDPGREGMFLLGIHILFYEEGRLGKTMESLLYSYHHPTGSKATLAMLVPGRHYTTVMDWAAHKAGNWPTHLREISTDDLATVEVALDLWDPHAGNEFTSLEGALQAAAQICAPTGR